MSRHSETSAQGSTSGFHLTTSQGEYWLLLDRRLTEAAGRVEELRHILTGSQQLCEFIQGQLGVYGGGMAMAHRIRSQFLLLQQSAYPNPLIQAEGIPIIDIPFQPHDTQQNRDRHCLIDLMFISLRGSQPLTGQTPPNPPEVYYRLPHALPMIGKLDVNNSLVGEPLAYSALDEWFRSHGNNDNNGFNFLYCQEGEVLFHLYAWRWLLRACQMRGGWLAVDPEADVEFATQPADFWQKGFWQSAPQASQRPEVIWLRSLEEEDNQLKRLRMSGQQEEAKHFLESAINIWKDDLLRKEADSTSVAYDFAQEWRGLGLLDDANQATPGLVELIHFAQQVARRISQHDISVGCAAKTTAMAELEAAETKLLAAIRDAKPIELAEIKQWKLDKTLRQIIYCGLKQGLATYQKPSGFQLLQQLHRVSRFPLIPFFYWIVLDPHRRVKEHLVFPVWQSYREETKAFVELPDQDGNTVIAQTGMVALALIAVKPLYQLDRSVLELDEQQRNSRLLERLYDLSSFFSQVARPVVDQGFGGLNSKLALRYRDAASGHEATAQLESATTLLPFYAKPAIAECIKGSLAYAQFFLSPMSGNALVKRWLVKENETIDEWIRRCAVIAWAITVARESRDITYEDEVEIIERAMTITPQVTIKINSVEVDALATTSKLYLAQDGTREELDLLASNLTRWLLAALSNAFKWCHPRTVEDNGISLVESWTNPTDFNQVIVEIVAAPGRSGLQIFNPLHRIETIVSDYHYTKVKKTGTLGVLRAVSDSIPSRYPINRVKFEKAEGAYKNRWETSITFNCDIFSVGEKQ